MRREKNPDVVVGGAKPKRIPKVQVPHQFSKAKLLAIVALAVVVAFAAWMVIKHRQPANNRIVVSSTCSTAATAALRKNVLADLAPGKLQQLYSDEQHVMTLPDYRNDPNCLFMLVMYDFSVNDLQSAAFNLQQMQKVYDPKKGFVADFKRFTMDELDMQLAATEKAQSAQAR